MKLRPAYVILPVLLASACNAVDDPPQIAEAFWTAAKEGDMDLAKSYLAEGGRASIDDAGSAPSVATFSLGETAVDGDRATVQTTVAAAAPQEMELAFATVLVREGDVWKVDLDQTTDEMMKSLFGATMGELAKKMGNAVGEAMGEAMEGVAKGMAEGLQAVGEAMADSLETGRR